MRHRRLLRDALAFVFLASGAAIWLLMYDLKGQLSNDPKIDLVEAAVLGVIFGAGLIWFGWRRILEQEREIRQTRAAEQQARFLAHHDYLTGLPNRRQAQSTLADVASRASAECSTHALLLLDLNGFKAINDTFGHPRGDEVLSVVAERMSKKLCPGNLLARTGGDEFAIILCDVGDRAEIVGIAEAIIMSLSEPVLIGSDFHPIGAGVGIASIPRDGFEIGELMRKADVALYRAKASRPSTFVFFEEHMDQGKREEDALRKAFAMAVASGSIVPFYQPIVNLKTGKIIACEALARWHDPTLGHVSPSRFIPLAEKTGQIKALSDHLLRRACVDAQSWPADVRLSFNVSPVLLRDRTFGLRTLAIIAEANLPVTRVVLEITEDAVTKDIEGALDVLQAFRGAGLSIFLDDFGTGATSLAHLQSFKFDGLKIDRRFVDTMFKHRDSALIVKAMIGLARALDLDIIAEGIEGEGQLSALEAEGCPSGQGYLFGRAMTADTITDHLSRAVYKRAG